MAITTLLPLLPILYLSIVSCAAVPGEPLAPNTLSSEEESEGWVLLFDGESTKGWRGFRQQEIPAGWQVVHGTLARVAGGGDIITVGQYEDFVLSLEWKISPGGNSGIFFHVSEGQNHVWQTGPEMQILDNAGHADGRGTLTSAGANYALHAPVADVTRPVGEFNEAVIEVRDGHVRHSLNGTLLLEYTLWTPEWQNLVEASKFASMPQYGLPKSGHIALQDHGDPVWFRNVKILPLSE